MQRRIFGPHAVKSYIDPDYTCRQRAAGFPFDGNSKSTLADHRRVGAAEARNRPESFREQSSAQPAVLAKAACIHEHLRPALHHLDWARDGPRTLREEWLQHAKAVARPGHHPHSAVLGAAPGRIPVERLIAEVLHTLAL